MDIPEVMVENELDQMLQEFEQRLQMQGMTLEMYTQFAGQDEAALKEQMKDDAGKRVKTSLTLEAIAKAENVEATEEEVKEELEKWHLCTALRLNSLYKSLAAIQKQSSRI